MKKHFLLIAALAATMLAQATVLYTEDFKYAVDDLEGKGGWTLTSNTSYQGFASPQVVNENLVYTGYVGSSVSGKSVSFEAKEAAPEAQRISYFQFDSKGVNSGSVYAAFVLKVESVVNSDRDFIAFEGSTGTTQRGRVFIRKDGDNTFKMGIAFNASKPATDNDWITGLSVSDTHLVVIKYEFVTGDKNDVVSIFVDAPMDKAENSSEVQACMKSNDNANATTDLSTLRGLSIKQRSSQGAFKFGHIRIATTWADLFAEEEAIESLATDFSYDNWGEVIAKANYPASGSYPSSVINGYELNSAFIGDGSIKKDPDNGPVVYANRVVVDKNGSFVTPLLENVGAVSLAFNTGSDTKTFTLQYLNEHHQWDLAESVESMRTVGEVTYNLNLNAPTKLRVLNNSGSTLYLWALTTTAVDTYTRENLTVGNYGTICLPYASASFEGAAFFEIVGKTADGVVFEEVDALEAGKPYLFRATDATMTVTYTGDPATAPADYNGFYGAFMSMQVAKNNYLISNNMVQKCGVDCSIAANRAYINLTEVADYVANNASARTMVMPFPGNPNVTGVEEATAAKATKALVNGKLVIVRGAHTFNANGAMLK